MTEHNVFARIIHPATYDRVSSLRGEERSDCIEAAVCKIIRTITPRYLRASREHEQSAGACSKRWLVVSRQPWRERKRDRRRCARVVAFGMRWETKLVARTFERIHRQVDLAGRRIARISSRSLARNGKNRLPSCPNYAITSNDKAFTVLFNEHAIPIRRKQWVAGIFVNRWRAPVVPSVLENGGHGDRSGMGPPD